MKGHLRDRISFTPECKDGSFIVIPFIDYGECTGCGACAELYPLFFIIRDEKAWVINYEKFSFEDNKKVVYCCPFAAITIE